MDKESFEKAKVLIDRISNQESELKYLQRFTIESSGDYALRDLRCANGNTVKVPVMAKQIILDITKAHYVSQINKLKKELREL